MRSCRRNFRRDVIQASQSGIRPNAITELINIFIITGLSFLAKAGIHTGTVHVKAKGMKDKIRINEKVKSAEEVK